MKLAYSYLRFSSAAQADGDSLRRQTSLAKSWCDRHGYRLDEATAFTDAGKSAFRGKHRRTGVLARFLAEVEAGRIPRGSVLIIENLDRLSRENPWDAVPLLCSIVNAGVSVVTLSPSEMRYERGRDLTGLILAVVEFGRGHSESASKSDRLSAIWTEKKRRARETGAIVTHRLPAWIEDRGGKLELVEARAAVVRRIYDLAIGGYGLSRIVRTFTDEQLPTWGRAKTWAKCYVHKILSGRVVLGEYQPIGGGKPDGPPIPGYYPAVIDETTWHRAQAALARRKDAPGRVGTKVASLFTGLLYDAETRGRMQIAMQTRGVKGRTRCRVRVLVSADSQEGRTPSRSFQYEVFEDAILAKLVEVKASDISSGSTAVTNESSRLADELAVDEARLLEIEEQLTGESKGVGALARAAAKLETRIAETRRQLDEARRRESTPVGEALKGVKALRDAVKGDEEARVRLRGLLQQLVEGIWVLIVPRASHRLAVVQIHFRGGSRRDYVLHYQAAAYKRPGGVSAPVSTNTLRGFDLRNLGDVGRVRDWVLRINLDGDMRIPGE